MVEPRQISNTNGKEGLKILIFKTFFALIMACSVLSCTQETPKTEFTAFIGSEPSGYDWQKTQDIVSIGVIYNLMEGLFSYDLKSPSLKVIPKLAKNYQHSKDFKKWTINLKKGVLWSDGKPLTAQHFVDAWQRLLDPKTGSPHAQRLFFVQGAKDFYNSNVEFDQVAIKASSDSTLEFALKRPTPHFLNILTGFFTFPIRKDLISNKDQASVTLGPYVIDSEQPAKTCLKSNPHYHSSPAELKKVCLLWFDQSQTAIRLFQKGKLDLVRSPDYATVVAKQLQTSYISGPTHGLYYLVFNTNKYPGNDRQFRRAIRSAIDYKELENFSGKNFDINLSLFPKLVLDTHYHLSNSTKRFVNKNEDKIIIATQKGPYHKDILSLISQKIKLKLNTETEIKVMENQSFFDRLKSQKAFDIIRLSWTPAVPLPQSYAEAFSSSSPKNHTGYSNPKYDTLIKQASLVSNAEASLKAYQKIERILLEEDLIALPLFTKRQSFLIRQDKYRLVTHPTERIDFIEILKMN